MDLEHAADWTGSEYRYTRVLAEGAWYTQSDTRWVLATRLRGGWVLPGGFQGLTTGGSSDEIVHPDKRLYAGGSNSVRGFAQNRLGPQVLQVLDVGKLTSTEGPDGGPLCAPESILDLSCDAGALPDDDFLPRPNGGTTMLEGSVEFRFPVAGAIWEGATFLDFGQVWTEDGGPDLGTVEFTPGLGIRYFSPIGPIRVDLAYRLGGEDWLQAVTSSVRPFDPNLDSEAARLLGPDGSPLPWVEAEELALLGPRIRWGDDAGWTFRRFQLHLSIGQAF
jgi:outer membrane protein insertion porin family/translocation and assembly module TamA